MRLLYIIVMMTLCGGIAAQQPLSFDDAFMLVLDNNKLIRSKRSDVTTAYYERQAARGLYYPKVELAGAYMLTDKDIAIDLSGKRGAIESGANALINQGIAGGLFTPAVGEMLRSLLAPLHNINLNYTLQKRSFGVLAAKITMPIYAGGRIRAANRAAALRLSMAEYQLDAAESRLHTTLVERYYGVVLLRSAVDVRRAVVEAVKRDLDDARAMEAEGIIAHSEVLSIEYRLSEVERDLAREEHSLSLTMRALCSMLGVDEEVFPIDNMFVCNNILSIDFYRDSANRLNSTLCGAELNIDLAKEGVVAARAELLPTVGIIGGASIYDYQLSNILPRWVVGAEASITLFDGLAKERNLRAAKSRVDGAIQAVESGRDDILLLVDNEYYNTCNALSDVRASQSAILAAESYYQSALDGFHAGVVSAAELLDAEVARAASKMSLLKAMYDYATSLARLLEAAGISHTFSEYRAMSINI